MIPDIRCGRCAKPIQQVSEKTVNLSPHEVTIDGIAFLLHGITVSVARVDGRACQGEPPFICVTCCQQELTQRLHWYEANR